jgi:transcriptional regulator with XRE-family HTH domain
MEQNTQALSLRAKKVGVMISAARLSSGKSLHECAELIDLDDEAFQAYEQGMKAPSLPELEVLAYYLNTPLEHFWETGPKEEPTEKSPIDAARFMSLRHRILGASLRQLRQNAALSIEKLAEDTGIAEEKLQQYENGQTRVPFPELELLLIILGGHLNSLVDQHGPVGIWRKQQQAVEQFIHLPVEVQEFITKPVNMPYLLLAQRLSGMPVEKLRAIAEGLLEITF